MKTDLIKLLLFIWMVVMGYFVYSMGLDVKYITDMIHAYLSMVIEHVRR